MTSTHTASTPTQNNKRTLLWTALSVTIFLIAFLLLSTIDDAQGNPWIDTSLLGQLLTTIGAVAALFGPLLVKNTKDVAVVKHEVKNDHTTNLRVEGDDRHGEIVDMFKDVRKDIGGIRAEIREDRQAVNTRLEEHSHRVYRLEHPHPKKED